VQANYADLRRPRITLWEQRAAVRALRAAHVSRVSEEPIIDAERRELALDAVDRRDAHDRFAGHGALAAVTDQL